MLMGLLGLVTFSGEALLNFLEIIEIVRLYVTYVLGSI